MPRIRNDYPGPPGSKFGRHLEDGTPCVSPNQITRVLSCGFQWEAMYILKMPQRSSIALTFGTLVHDVLATHLQGVLDGAPLQAAAVIAEARSNAVSTFTDPKVLANLIDVDEVDVDALQAEAGKCAAAAVEWIKKSGMEPLRVEQKVGRLYEIDGVRVFLLGYPDVYAIFPNGRRAVVDWKFPAKAPGTKDDGKADVKVDYVYACSVYADSLIEDGFPVEDLLLVHVPRTKTPTVNVTTIGVTQDVLELGHGMTVRGIRKILRGDFAPEPLTAGWKCSKKFCGCYGECPAMRFRNSMT